MTAPGSVTTETVWGVQVLVRRTQVRPRQARSRSAFVPTLVLVLAGSLAGCGNASEALVGDDASAATTTPPASTAGGMAQGDGALADSDEATVVLPPDGAGDLSPVAVSAVETLPPVDVDDEVELVAGLQAEIELGETTVQARRPGEIGGEAAEVKVLVTNTGRSAQDLSTLFVEVADAKGTPLSPLYGAPYDPLAGTLEGGASAAGIYVFTLDDTLVQPFSVQVSPAADEPLAVFVGSTE